jgi:23S rRNA pseudouridine1911/1915/1917 synthase
VSSVHELSADRDGERLDVFVARSVAELTRSRVRKLIDEGHVTVGGAPAKKASVTLDSDDLVVVTIPPPEPTQLVAEEMQLSIVFEDADLLVIDKPPGLAVHPSPGHSSHTLVNGIMAHCTDLSGIGGELRPGIVHRLDKDTSGLIIVAKNDAAHTSLADQLKDRKVKKTYIALVEGHVTPPEGLIDGPIGRDPHHRKRMAVVRGGRDARTGYRVLKEIGGRTLLEVQPETGRTHQIRVHLASLNHPIVGDFLYGRRRESTLSRQFLHAQRLTFKHPRTGEQLELETPLAGDLTSYLEELERD